MAIPGFVVRGFEAALGAATGLPLLGLFLVIGAALIAAAAISRGHRPSSRVVAILLAIAAEYALVAATRAGVTADQVLYPRYTYVSGILMVQVLALAAGPALGGLRARGLASPDAWRRLGARALGPLVLTIALTWNLALLTAGRNIFLERAAMTRALVAESIRPDPPPGADLARDLILVPAPVDLRRLVAEHGSPLADVIFPWAVQPIPDEVRAEARRRLVEGPPIPVPGDASQGFGDGKAGGHPGRAGTHAGRAIISSLRLRDVE
jgi:hypothetical protein